MLCCCCCRYCWWWCYCVCCCCWWRCCCWRCYCCYCGGCCCCHWCCCCVGCRRCQHALRARALTRFALMLSCQALRAVCCKRLAIDGQRWFKELGAILINPGDRQPREIDTIMLSCSHDTSMLSCSHALILSWWPNRVSIPSCSHALMICLTRFEEVWRNGSNPRRCGWDALQSGWVLLWCVLEVLELGPCPLPRRDVTMLKRDVLGAC